MKEYPLTDSDLHDLRNVGAGATVFFSLGSLCLGFWANLYATITYSSGLPDALVTAGAARQEDALVGAILFYAIGAVLTVMGYTRVADIKAEVDFPGEPRSKRLTWLKVMTAILIVLGLVAVSFWFGTRLGIHGQP